MTKKWVVLLIVTVFIMLNIVTVNAYTIDYSYASNGSEFTSKFSGSLNDFELLTFENISLGDVNSLNTKNGLPWAWTGNATIVNGSVSNQYAAPYGLGAIDISNYIAVPNPIANGSVKVQLGCLYNYFGLWWGSIDSYNTLSFYNGNTLVASITGSDAVRAIEANGNQKAPSTNLYVNIFDIPSFDSFEMKSTGYAFEADNITVGNTAPVPEPSTMALIGFSMFCIVIYSKRRRK